MINEIDRNTIELINRICQEIDNIEYSFDILDNDFNERVKEACRKDRSHIKELSKNE